MKKTIYFAMAVAAGAFFASCQPTLIDGPDPCEPVTAEAINAGFSYAQFADEACTIPQADGNYIKFESKAGVVQFYSIDAKSGAEKIIATGAGGVMKILPKRGQSPEQTVKGRMINQDGSITLFEQTFTVFVPGELPEELQILLGEGVKSWTWHCDSTANISCWGNAGFTQSGAGFTATNVDGKWWGVKSPEELATPDQIKHSNTGTPTGEEATGAYMTFNEDGELIKYAPDGTELHKGTYSVSNWDATRSTGWELGKLNTSAASILFPFAINKNGFTPEVFDIMYLDKNYMTLTYVPEGTGGWSEITFWMFKSFRSSDALHNGSERKWYWANDGNGAWGNAGYTESGAGFTATNVDGKWWGAAAADLADQMSHSATGTPTGEESDDAYMIFDSEGTVESFTPEGSKIRGGDYTVTMNADGGRNNNWELGKLSTTGAAIFFPFKINGGGEVVTTYDIMYMDAENITLTYVPAGTGGWSEITFWRFRSEPEAK